MKTLNFASAAVSALSFLALILTSTVSAQQSGIKRTDLQRYDLTVPGYQTVQARIDFEAHTAFGKHSHPGEEVIYVLDGVLEYEVEGQSAVRLKAGEVLFIPAGVVHSARNNSHVKASELATYIVEKGKPVLVMQK
ncbi:cupin domain-containing protein [Flavobacterium johnsoniae]|jgi:quercetin dioxygenase-like cupin family protein|uniref:Cupin 2, conserved barrel domain protein n=1 Tax=Flavobacterium johnsoniae (strain ATCC 17061 / DSM 2064 / JCM 8514 / BCRC 14874 / CCUG 350202 / NBRC 14942 / NCIMB 11054 / UW101) TaxID=376686 RepID=A5FDH3_FLAJ1|nr:cupin domain-containing protein [Flavobacterium johnsoniae]ABQ06750.1 Cupin 2, conserved barrel domain protein [Flavobacterium johnsoniae UW101]OXE97387.1 cupin [Flavobacterium johnsoniae UW101]WQG81421.1 cupin domain-containing protein [Flavobacterium johnsoniae UW101]SHL41847.1 Cupin domain protein [Flavobacterium johnsoniae]